MSSSTTIDSSSNGITNATAPSPDASLDVLLFDLDGTLYDQACGYEESIHNNIFQFMVDKQGGKFDGIDTIEQAKMIWKPIFDKYNLTKRGLLGEGFEFDGREYDTYIRRGADKYIREDPELRKFLLSLPKASRKIIFTNAPETSANEILSLLGVQDIFEIVIGTDFFNNEICKPELGTFTKVLDGYLNLPKDQYHRVCYFEDSFKNLLVGKKLGLTTVFVQSETLINEGRTIEDLQEQFDAVIVGKVGMGLKETLPQLWQ